MTIDADTLIQALADGTRLRALVLLNRETSLCVCTGQTEHCRHHRHRQGNGGLPLGDRP